jgi:hypothetical protein
MNDTEPIRTLMQAFQEGYRLRDVAQVDDFMQLFTEDAEVIGTGGLRPGEGEWYLGRDAARAMIKSDWEGWGDVLLEWDSLSIHQRGDAAYIAVAATVTEKITDSVYEGYLGYLKEFVDKAPMTAEQKMLYVLRGASNLLYEIGRGETFVWPLRLTAVAVCDEGDWRFAQMNFSFPAIYLPDVRRMEGEDRQWY